VYRTGPTLLLLHVGMVACEGPGEVYARCPESPQMAPSINRTAYPSLGQTTGPTGDLDDPSTKPLTLPIDCGDGRLYADGVICGMPARPKEYANRDLKVTAIGALFDRGQMESLHEPTMACGLKPEVEYLRLFRHWGLAHPWVVRIECSTEGGYLLVKQQSWDSRLDAKERNPGGLVNEIGALDLSRTQCDGLFALMDDSDFWSELDEQAQEDILVGVGDHDAPTVYLEGVRRGHYNFMYCNRCPGWVNQLRGSLEWLLQEKGFELGP
jgi:hypothetical protein